MLRVNLILALFFFGLADFIGVGNQDISGYGKRAMLFILYIVLMGTSSHYLSGTDKGLFLIRDNRNRVEASLFALTCVLFFKACVFIGFCVFEGLEKLVFSIDILGIILLIPFALTAIELVLGGNNFLIKLVGIENRLDSRVLGRYRKVYYELIYYVIIFGGISSLFFKQVVN